MEEKRLEAKLAELKHQQEELAEKTDELRRIMKDEQEDVDRLNSRNLTAFYYKVTGKMEKNCQKRSRKPMRQRSGMILRKRSFSPSMRRSNDAGISFLISADAEEDTTRSSRRRKKRSRKQVRRMRSGSWRSRKRSGFRSQGRRN